MAEEAIMTPAPPAAVPARPPRPTIRARNVESIKNYLWDSIPSGNVAHRASHFAGNLSAYTKEEQLAAFRELRALGVIRSQKPDSEELTEITEDWWWWRHIPT